jgi:hypothetical protein
MDIENYTIENHIHRFAVWTAARAASTSRLSNAEVLFIIDKINLREEINMLCNSTDLNDMKYRIWLREQVKKICEIVSISDWIKFKKDKFCFGLGAKIISIYIKTVEIIPTRGLSLLSRVAHPPIDSVLLKNINKKYNLNLDTAWSTFSWETYETVIDQVFEKYGSNPKWKIEVDWELLKSGDKNS